MDSVTRGGDGHSCVGCYGYVRLTGVSFSQFHERKGYKKAEELNGSGPKNEAPNQRGIKIKPRMERNLKIFGATRQY